MIKARSDLHTGECSLDINPRLNLAFTVGLVAAVLTLQQSNWHLEKAGKCELGFHNVVLFRTFAQWYYGGLSNVVNENVACVHL